MSLRKELEKARQIAEFIRLKSSQRGGALKEQTSVSRGRRYTERWDAPHANGIADPGETDSNNPLWEFFQARTTGPGIWKWEHYFDIYDRHFSRFRGREVHLVEVGIYSGGSLDMWREYFGPRCHVYGIDIEPACRVYENESTTVFIGDQEDRGFWADFRKQVPRVDIVIDDGGHQPEQQIVTFEELVPHLAPGGVYLCEDVHGEHNDFASYARGVADKLNAFHREDMSDPTGDVTAAPFQASVASMHFYPYVAVLEKHARPTPLLYSTKRGTEWQPFFDE